MGTQIVQLRFHDVKKKASKLAKAMREPRQSTEDSVFAPLKEIGVIKKGFKNNAYDFDAVGGEVYVRHTDGVKVVLHIGDVAKGAISENLRVSLYAMITAGVDESIFTMPEKPEDPQDKEYLRKLKLREDAIKAATIRASGFNQLHANWIYLIPEDVIEAIRPDIDIGDAKPLAEDAGEKEEVKEEVKEEAVESE